MPLGGGYTGDGVRVAAENREVEGIRGNRGDRDEDDNGVRDERIAVVLKQTFVGQSKEGRVAQTQYAAFDNRLRYPANEKHSSQRHDEGLQLEPRHQEALPEAHPQRRTKS